MDCLKDSLEETTHGFQQMKEMLLEKSVLSALLICTPESESVKESLTVEELIGTMLNS